LPQRLQSPASRKKTLRTVQAEISRLERRDDYYLLTLRNDVKALDGSLESRTFGDRRVRLRAS